MRPGDFAPMFITPSSVNPTFRLDATGGRRIVLFFMGSMGAPGASAALDALVRKALFFEEHRTLVYIVSADVADQTTNGLAKQAEPYVVFWDFQLAINRQYGMIQSHKTDETTLLLGSVILDENSRFVGFVPLTPERPHAEDVASTIASIPSPPPPRCVTHQPPVLLIPDVISPDYCRTLIETYRENGGREGGSLVDLDGQTVHVHDHYHKRRKDWIAPTGLLVPLHAAIKDRIAPEVKKAFHFTVSALERDLIGCYEASTSGHFRPHRDDSTAGTTHRRYALTINLNAEDYEGGDLRFPEYSLDTYRPPTGGAIVFSCSLMHEVLPVTRGCRYAFISFLLSPETASVLSAYIKEQIAAGRASEFIVDR